MLDYVNAALEGFFLGASLIIAIGAQNAFVLRQGLVARHVGPVVAICALSDALLISLGAAGMGSLVNASAGLFVGLAFAGAAFLAWYGIGAARRMLTPSILEAGGGDGLSLRAAVTTVLLLTWANPHVYLDTVVLLGALANEHRDGRWLFGVGAVAASTVWFTSLGYGATRLSRLFAKPMTWRVLDAAIAATMLALGTYLALS